MNYKKSTQIRMVAWALVAIILSVVLVVGIIGNNIFFNWQIFNNRFNYSDMKEIKTYTFDKSKDIKNIKTKLNTIDLVFSENKEDNIKVIIKSNKKLKDNKYIDVKIDSNTLDIRNVNQNLLEKLKGYALEVEVKLPKSYKNSINIDNKVGDITFESKLNLENLTVNVNTGDISFNFLECKNSSIKSQIGDIDVEEFIGCGSIESKVGDISCNIEDLNGNFNIKSKTGDIDLSINKDLSFKFETNKSFEDINTSLTFNNVSQSSDFFSGEYGKNPKYKITSNIKTGDISIND